MVVGFRSGEAEKLGEDRAFAWCDASDTAGDGGDVLGCVAAAATGEVDEAGFGEVAEVSEHVIGQHREACF